MQKDLFTMERAIALNIYQPRQARYRTLQVVPGEVYCMLHSVICICYIFSELHVSFICPVTSLHAILISIDQVCCGVMLTCVYMEYRPLGHHGNAANLEEKTKEIFSSGN